MFARESGKVDADDFGAVERLSGVLVAESFEVGREFVDEQVQGVHAFLLGERSVRPTKEKNALILGGEFAGQQVHSAHDAERYVGAMGDGPQLFSLGSTVNIDAVAPVPNVVHGDGIGHSVFVDHRENAVFGGLQKLDGALFVQETVAPTDGFVDIFHCVGRLL